MFLSIDKIAVKRGMDMQERIIQRDFVNDAGSSVVMTLFLRGSRSELLVENEDYDGQGGPVHEEFGTESELRNSMQVWSEDLKRLHFRAS
jgi:hypothetical protein